MDQIRVVMAELDVVLALLDATPKDTKRIKQMLDLALDDLKAAAASITGQSKGGGEV